MKAKAKVKNINKIGQKKIFILWNFVKCHEISLNFDQFCWNILLNLAKLSAKISLNMYCLVEKGALLSINEALTSFHSLRQNRQNTSQFLFRPLAKFGSKLRKKSLTKTFSFDQFWPVLTSFDQFWLVLTSVYQFLPVLTIFDHFWPFLTSFDQFWPVLTSFDQILYHFDQFWPVWPDFVSFCFVHDQNLSLSTNTAVTYQKPVPCNRTIHLTFICRKLLKKNFLIMIGWVLKMFCPVQQFIQLLSCLKAKYHYAECRWAKSRGASN